MRLHHLTLLACLALPFLAAGCAAGNPGGCNSNADCTEAGRRVCDPGSHTCVPCNVNRDCPAQHLCKGNQCVPGCVETSDCPSGQVCKAGACVPGCDDARACQTGQCDLTTNQCVPCINDQGCGGAMPRCLAKDKKCVRCVPTNDDCPSGQYCAADYTCQQGCKNDADCPSGKCLPDHSCGMCNRDDQCAAGKVCDGGMCVDPCMNGQACGNGGLGLCCGKLCKDTRADVMNCGGCGMACGNGQGCCGGACKELDTLTDCGACGNACKQGEFCDGKACAAATYPNFCNNKTVYIIYDGIKVDDDAANTMGSTILANCPMGVTVKKGQQTDPALVNQQTGQPLAGGGVTYVLGGGPYGNKPVKWLEMTKKATPIYFESDGISTYFWRRRDGSTAAKLASSACTAKYDQFLVELVTDPMSGTLSLIGYGACVGGLGTRGAAWYYANVMLPDRMKYPDSWYVFEWTDGDGDGQAGMKDTFKILASGK